jgi:hypothetical protein
MGCGKKEFGVERAKLLGNKGEINFENRNWASGLSSHCVLARYILRREERISRQDAKT